jgi:hypothetical protein
MSDEPVLEINHSSCESDEIVVEERPLRDIVKGLSASSKASYAKKDLVFDKSVEHVIPPLINNI